MKILSLLIVVFSIFGGILGSYISETLIQNNENNIVNKNKSINIDELENQIINKVRELSPSIANVVIKKDLIIYRSDPFGFFQTPVGAIKRKVGGGTCFFITKDGILITNKHVISDRNAEYTVITNDNQEYNAKVLAIDPSNDLAILKINSENEFKPLSFVKDSDSGIKIGQFAIAIGNALAEFQNSVSLGVISGKDRTIEIGNEKLIGLLQTDAAINPGNSGGPLINLDGKVMGINTAIVDGSQGIGFSIPLNEEKINSILDSIKK